MNMESIKKLFEVVDLKVVGAIVGGIFFVSNARFILDAAGFFFLLNFIYNNLLFAEDREGFVQTFLGDILDRNNDGSVNVADLLDADKDGDVDISDVLNPIN